MIYAPLIDLPESSGSEIVLNCRSGHDLPITPIFYTVEGETYTGAEIVLKPAEIRFVDTKSLIPAKERNRHKWGGMAFSYFGGFMEAWAQLTLRGVRGGGSVNVLFTVLSQKRSNTAEAVWWTPHGGSAVIALGNSSDQQVHANLIFSPGGSQSVDVAPFGTEIVRLHSNTLGAASGGRVEAVSINYTGPAGSLIPSGYTASDAGKFASMIRFYDTQHVVQQDLFANNLRVKDATPHMVLRNVSADFITASPAFLPASGDLNNAVKLEPIRLAPSETTEVDLSGLLRSAVSRSDFDSVSVQVGNSGNPGSLIGALYSISKKTGVTYDVPLRDSGPPRASTGGYPVRLDGDYTTVISISNTTDKQGDFTMQLNYDNGPYVIGMIRLSPGATRMFDIRKIRDEQTPDIYGHPLPRNLQIAQAKWSIRHNIRLNGRAEVVSLKDGVSSSYSCFSCCPNTFSGGAIYPQGNGDCPSVAAGGTLQFSAFEQDTNGYYCGGTPAAYQVYPSWNSSDSCVATIDSNGLVTTLAGGFTTISCYWDVTYWEWDDIDESCNESFAPHEEENCMYSYAELTGLSPSRGPIGTTVGVSISGAYFPECEYISIGISGDGVSASGIDWHNPALLTANFAIAADATPGNHSVTVYFNGVPTNSVNFYVQVPTSFTPLTLQTANLGCPTNYIGFGGQVRYEVRDQQGQTMNAPGYTPQEHFTRNGDPAFEGFRAFATPPTTDSSGRFLDIPVGTCFEAPPGNNFCADIIQTFNIVVGSTTYPIGTVTTRRDCMQGIRVTVTNGSTNQGASLGTVN